MPLTTIASFREAYAAHIARAKLEAEGIPAFVADEHLVGVHPLYSDAIGGVKLRVAEEDAERARSIVTEDRSGDLRGVVEQRPRRAARASTRCPACGARSVTRAVDARAPRVARASFPVVVWTSEFRCDDCGLAW